MELKPQSSALGQINQHFSTAIFATPFATLIVQADQNQIMSARWSSKETGKIKEPDFPHDLHRAIEQQLNAYFKKSLKQFDLPLKQTESSFEQKVFEGLTKVLPGETISYKELASHIKAPKSARAVGNALGRNPHLLFTPCHRVVLSSGAIGHYAGGQELKRRLLDFESIKPSHKS